MSSIPLPALDVKPPQQENPLDALTRVMQIKSMQNAQGLQQEQLKGAQLENQQRSLAAADEVNARHAFHDWDGKDSDDLLGLMQKYGVGPKTFTSMATGLLDMKQKVAALTKDQLANVQNFHDQARGAIMGVIQAPPDKQQDAWTQMKQGAIANPAFAPARQLIDQLPDTYPGDEEAQLMANRLALGSVLAKEETERTAAGARKEAADTGQQRLTAELPGIQSENVIKGAQAAVAPQTAQLGITQKQTEIAKNVADIAKTKVETQNLGEQPIFAVDPNTNERVMTTRPEAQAKGYTNPVSVKEGDVSKETDARAMINDVQLNKSRYLSAMQQVYSQPMTTAQKNALTALTPEKLGIDFGSLFKLELPDVMQKVANASAFSVLSQPQKQAVVGYYSTLASVPAAQKALTNIGKANKEMMDLELRTIPTPLMDQGSFQTMLDRFQGNIDQTSKKTVRIPGMPSTADIRNQIEGRSQPQQTPSRMGFNIPDQFLNP